MSRKTLALLVLIGCAAPTDPQVDLDAASSAPVVRHVADHGYRGATFRVPASGRSPSVQAQDFLDRFGSAVGLSSPSAVSEREVRPGADGDDSETVVYDGQQDGRRVYGSEYRVRVEDGDVTYAGGTLVENPDADLGEPELSAEEAVERLEESVGHGLSLVRSELVAFNMGLFVGVAAPSTLAWMVEVRGIERWLVSTVFVDAKTGEHVMGLPRHASDRARETYSVGGVHIDDYTPADAELQLVENDPQPMVAMVTPSVMRGHRNAGVFYDHLMERHSRDSIDDSGLTLKIYTDFDPTWDNAYWTDDDLATFYNPAYTALDTVAHEFTHGMVHFTAGLEYVYEPGALNESFGDIYAVFVVDGASWQFGDDDAGGTIRDLQDPSTTPYPSHTSAEVRPGTLDICSVGARCYAATETCISGVCIDEDDDAGGVHSNSSIPNHAIYLMSEGGTHAVSMIEVEGIGLAKVQALAYRALTGFLSPLSLFVDYRFAMRASAIERIEETKDLTGDAVFTYENCGSVLNAFAAVGIGAEDTDSDCFADDIDNCPCTYNPEQNADDCEGGRSPTACVDECVRIEGCDDCTANEACGFCDGTCRATADEMVCSARVFDATCMGECTQHDSCTYCLQEAGCTWCGSACQSGGLSCTDDDGNLVDPPESCYECALWDDCESCGSLVGCAWDGMACARQGDVETPQECDDPCDGEADCAACTNAAGCGWDGTSCVTGAPGATGLITREAGCFDCSMFAACDTCATNGFCAWCPGTGCVNDSTSACADRIRSPLACE